MTEEAYLSLQPGDIIHSDDHNEKYNLEFIRMSGASSTYKVFHLNGELRAETHEMSKSVVLDYYQIIKRQSPDEQFLINLYGGGTQ